MHFSIANARRRLGLLAVLCGLLAAAVPAPAQESQTEADFEEHLGEIVPGDIVLVDEEGNETTFGALVDKPTILNFVYFECPGICTPLLTEIADILGKSNLDPAKQPFQILSVSFEPNDKPETAKAKRANYLAQLSRPLPEETWRFLTTDKENIERITGAIGFHYKKTGGEYIHPGGLIMISPERKIVRYLYGTQFLPFDFQMGVHEASQGTVSPTSARLLRFCFSYDPEARTYAFNITRVVAVVMLTSLLFFILFLVYTTRIVRRKES